MIHPIPSGTRDVLPDETREVRAITDTLRRVFERHGYGEIYTPALEYESVLARADMAEAQPAYRVFDETGAGARAALRHDRADRPRRRHPLRLERAAAALLLLRALLPRRPPPARPAARAAAGRHRADRLAGAPGHRRGAHGALPLPRRHRPEGLPRRPRRRLAVPGADEQPGRPRGGPPGAARGARAARLRRARARARRARRSPARPPSCCSRCPSAAAAPRCSSDAPEQAEQP